MPGVQAQPKTWPDTIGRVAVSAAVAAAIIGVLVQWAWHYYTANFSLPFWVGLVGWPGLALWVVALVTSALGFVYAPNRLLPGIGWACVVAAFSLFVLYGWVWWVSVPVGLLFLALPWIALRINRTLSWGRTVFVILLVLVGLAACAVIGVLSFSNAYG